MTGNAEPENRGGAGTDWHVPPVGEVLDALGSGPGGLTRAEVGERRRRHGPNVLPAGARPGRLAVWLHQFRNPLIYLLLGAAMISAVIGEFTDAGFIFGVLQFNALIGAVQEWRAETQARALQRMVRSRVTVRRDGSRAEVDSTELVPGDIVQVESGLRVPADIRLLRSLDLLVDQSLLTGESEPVYRDAAATPPGEATVSGRANCIHAGTTVLRGRGLGVVFATGAATAIGQIAGALAAPDTTPPPLMIRLEKFTRVLGLAMVGAIAVIAVTQFVQGMDPAQIFLVAVALAVAAIPEGLPVAITVALAVATSRMARRHVVVRGLPAVEGLGACTLIASDKTGTLTRNELVVRRLRLADGRILEVSGEGWSPEGTIAGEDGGPPGPGDAEAARRLALAAVLCNEAALEATADGLRPVGDTVDAAFLVLGRKLGLDENVLTREWPRRGLVPFEPGHRYAASSHEGPDGRAVCYVKGAAETVIPMCRDPDGGSLLEAATRMAAAGFRVLALAAGPAPAEAAGRPSDLGFLGLAGLIDPVRSEVPEAIRRCHEAGIDVRMVTGDHPATALAIAREAGMEVGLGGVVTGQEIAADGHAGEAILRARVFARVEPMQKLEIVRALQQAGHFVAVTGDGVNDAPALKAAHIGVAMGRAGTDVARSAADLILTDDNFASIVAGVEEGRVAYDNVRKVILLLVGTGAGEITVFFLALMAGLPLPLFAVQLLWLNLVTNGVQDVALAFEKPEPGVLQRPPRPPDQPVFDRRMIEQTLLVGCWMGFAGFGFFWWSLERGVPEAEARNALLLLMVLFENVHVFNCRSEWRSAFRVPLLSNPWLPLAVLLALGVHLAAMYIPGVLRDVLHAGPVDLRTGLMVGGIALSLLVVMEIYKRIRPAPGAEKPR